MEYFLIAIKLVLGLSILNVWILNPNKASKWRGGDAASIKEEFIIYGLPDWSLFVVGFCKISLAIFILASITYHSLEQYSALGLAIFLSGSILMHFKVKDPLFKSVPAASFLILCLMIIFLS